MAEKKALLDVNKPIKEIPEFKIKYNDVFHLKNLYVMMHELLVDEGWFGDNAGASQPGEAHSDIEKFYMERHHQKSLHRGGMELWLWWRVKKTPMSRGGGGYFVYTLDIDWHGMYLETQEIMHQGKKMKVQKGELEMFFRPRIVRTDKGKAWQDHWLLRHFQELYERRIYNREFDKYEKDLWREAYRIQGVIKAYLNLRNFIPVPEPFHPKLYGYEGQF